MGYRIPFEELSIRVARASGPGGQHVNKVATRVDVRWNVTTSPSLSETQRKRLTHRLAHRIDTRGWIRTTSAATRSQSRNRTSAIDRLQALVSTNLRVEKPRKRTKPSRAQKEKRLKDKKRRSERKSRRKPVGDHE